MWFWLMVYIVLYRDGHLLCTGTMKLQVEKILCGFGLMVYTELYRDEQLLCSGTTKLQVEKNLCGFGLEHVAVK